MIRSDPSRRRVELQSKLMKRFFIACCLFALFGAGGCSRSQFEKDHDQAVRQNPMDVTMELRVVGGATTIHASETLRLEQIYTAKYGNYQIEVLDNANDASLSEEAAIFDGTKMRWEALTGRFATCCQSRHVWLTLEPTPIPYRLGNPHDVFGQTQPFRRLKLPVGTHQVYVRSRRVFRDEKLIKTYSGQGLVVVAKNILTIRVIENDAAWAAKKLAEVVAALDRGKASPDDKEWILACDVLALDLNSDQAVLEKLRRLRGQQSCSWPSYLSWAANPKLAYTGLYEIIKDPLYPMKGVSGYASALATLRTRERYPDYQYGHPLGAKGPFPQEAYRFSVDSYREISQDLLRLCASKPGRLASLCANGDVIIR
jgi:hypothetical protein